MPEVWQPIPGFEGYSASACGEIRNDKTNRVLRQARSGKYLNVWVAGSKRYVHSLVAAAFCGERPDGLYCCHKNDQPHDNRAENLYWGSNRQNQLDRVRNGKPRTTNKLSESQVREVRAALAEGATNASIAKRYRVDPSTISNIKTGRLWSSLPAA